MNGFGFIALSAFIISFFLGVFVLCKDHRNLLNRLFVGYCLVGCYGAFMEYSIIEAESIKRVYFWLKQYTLIWPYLLAFQLHFVLLFIERVRLARNKIALTVIYAPAILFSVIGVLASEFKRTPVQQSWGWALLAPENTVAVYAANVYISGIATLAIVLSLAYAVGKRREPRKRRQAVFLFIGLLMNMTWSVITAGVLPDLGRGRYCTNGA